MDPLSISLELELGALLLGAVGAVATWMHNRHEKARRKQHERHFQETRMQHERHHQERLAVMRMEDCDPEAISER